MKLFKESRILYAFITALILWLFLPATTKTTVNTPYVQLGTGYAPVANFSRHSAPPKLNKQEFKNLVWRHERYSVLWLPFWGSKAGIYGLYKTVRHGRFRRIIFVPLSNEQAQKYASMIKVKLIDGPPISYWSLFFGWLVAVPLVLVFYWDTQFYSRLREFI